MTLRVCLLGLLKGRRGNILAGSKTFRLRINRFKNFPLRNTILLSQRTRGKGRDFFAETQIIYNNIETEYDNEIGPTRHEKRAGPFFFAGLPDFSYPLAANSSLHRVDRHITTLLPPTM